MRAHEAIKSLYRSVIRSYVVALHKNLLSHSPLSLFEEVVGFFKFYGELSFNSPPHHTYLWVLIEAVGCSEIRVAHLGFNPGSLLIALVEGFIMDIFHEMSVLVVDLGMSLWN